MVRFDNSRRPGYSRASAYCAILVMLGGLLSACSVWDTGTAALSGSSDTSASPAPDSVDPWTLPIEERPELFNPCTEVSLDDLTDASLENPTPWPEGELNREAPPLKQCGWKVHGYSLIIASAWTELDEIRPQETETKSSPADRSGFESVLLTSRPSSPWDSCGIAAKTDHGVVTFDMTSETTDLPGEVSPSTTCSMVEELFDNLVGRIEGALL